MSMIMQYIRIRDDELIRLRKLLANDPDRAFDYADELADGSAEGVPVERSRSLDTDKAWDGLAFLIHQAGTPAVCVVHGGEVLTTDDWGYEPPRYLTPDQVGQAAADLDRTPFELLAGGYAPELMLPVYPQGWWDAPDGLAYLRGWYGRLTTFFQDAASHRDGMIIFLT